MSLDSHLLRSVMSRFATGVTVVTARDAEGRGCGLTVNAFTSVSLDPPLILVSLARDSATRDAILGAGTFAVNILAAEDRDLAARFSRARRAVRFRGLETRNERTGSPVLADALAWLDCAVQQAHEAGDHSLVLGEPLAVGSRDGSPLVFYAGQLRGMDP